MTGATATTLTPEQASRRLGFIGGTDAPRILGISRFGGPLQVYEEKMGIAPPRGSSPAAHWGSLLETAIATEYARQTGRRLRKYRAPAIHPEYPFIGGYLDRRVVGEPGLLEVKTSSAYMRDDWGPAGTDEVPDDYYVQVQHYMLVTGLQWADIAALIGGQEYRRFRIDRNDAFIADLLDAEITFWREHVEAANPPPVGGTPADAAYLSNRFPRAENEVIIPATPEDEQMLRELFRAKADVRAAEDALRLAENRVKERIAEQGGLAGAAGVVTWKQATRTSIDWKVVAHEWRNLLGLYVPMEAWERLTAEADAVVEQQTKQTTYRTLRVRGEDDTNA